MSDPGDENDNIIKEKGLAVYKRDRDSDDELLEMRRTGSETAVENASVEPLLPSGASETKKTGGSEG